MPAGKEAVRVGDTPGQPLLRPAAQAAHPYADRPPGQRQRGPQVQIPGPAAYRNEESKPERAMEDRHTPTSARKEPSHPHRGSFRQESAGNSSAPGWAAMPYTQSPTQATGQQDHATPNHPYGAISALSSSTGSHLYGRALICAPRHDGFPGLPSLSNTAESRAVRPPDRHSGAHCRPPGALPGDLRPSRRLKPRGQRGTTMCSRSACVGTQADRPFFAVSRQDGLSTRPGVTSYAPAGDGTQRSCPAITRTDAARSGRKRCITVSTYNFLMLPVPPSAPFVRSLHSR